MSTSFIYHTQGLTGYDYVHQKFINGGIHIKIRPKWRLLRCPACQSKHIIRRGVVLRKLRTVPIGRKPVWILVEIPRIFCLDCKVVRQIHTRISTPKRGYTWAFERLVLDLYKIMTLKDIAAFLGVGWDCVKDIVKRNLNRRFSKPSLKNVRYLAIDEISLRKEHKYITLVLDLERGVVLFVGDGNGADALDPFWLGLGNEKDKSGL